ncbi:MAG: hypothetical protein NT165_02395 [Candidatus Falkowbacteria bacterium]|nr:hypothetical protein [Candidatus Falkowbacteria bacterium]
MVTKELLDYIKQQKAQGISEELIVNTLTDKGWAKDDIAIARENLAPPNLTPQPPNNNLGKPVFKGRLLIWFLLLIQAASIVVVMSAEAYNFRRGQTTKNTPPICHTEYGGAYAQSVCSIPLSPSPSDFPMMVMFAASGVFFFSSLLAFFVSRRLIKKYRETGASDSKLLKFFRTSSGIIMFSFLFVVAVTLVLMFDRSAITWDWIGMSICFEAIVALILLISFKHKQDIISIITTFVFVAIGLIGLNILDKYVY